MKTYKMIAGVLISAMILCTTSCNNGSTTADTKATINVEKNELDYNEKTEETSIAATSEKVTEVITEQTQGSIPTPEETPYDTSLENNISDDVDMSLKLTLNDVDYIIPFDKKISYNDLFGNQLKGYFLATQGKDPTAKPISVSVNKEQLACYNNELVKAVQKYEFFSFRISNIRDDGTESIKFFTVELENNGEVITNETNINDNTNVKAISLLKAKSKGKTKMSLVVSTPNGEEEYDLSKNFDRQTFDKKLRKQGVVPETDGTTRMKYLFENEDGLYISVYKNNKFVLVVEDNFNKDIERITLIKR